MGVEPSWDEAQRSAIASCGVRLGSHRGGPPRDRPRFPAPVSVGVFGSSAILHAPAIIAAFLSR
jgi:hypothetical protein